MIRNHERNTIGFITCALPTATLLLSLAAQVAFARADAENPLDRTAKAVTFRNDMRQLWMEHVIWTRMVIVSVAANQQDLGAATDRLMRNQVDIANAIRPYYGDDAANKLTSLLNEHIAVAAELLVAAKAGDTAKADDAKQRWYRNADEISAFLSGANPQNWPLDAVKSMMKMHLDTTMDEAAARLRGDWKADAAAFDKVQAHILMMADALSMGIIHQFPAKFADNPDGASMSHVMVNMGDNVFQPREIKVSPGTMVEWANAGRRPHTVTADSANAAAGGPDSSREFPDGIQPGKSFAWTVPADAGRGTKWYYHCALHGSGGNGSGLGMGMSGVIIVQ